MGCRNTQPPDLSGLTQQSELLTRGTGRTWVSASLRLTEAPFCHMLPWSPRPGKESGKDPPAVTPSTQKWHPLILHPSYGPEQVTQPLSAPRRMRRAVPPHAQEEGASWDTGAALTTAIPRTQRRAASVDGGRPQPTDCVSRAEQLPALLQPPSCPWAQSRTRPWDAGIPRMLSPRRYTDKWHRVTLQSGQTSQHASLYVDF